MNISFYSLVQCLGFERHRVRPDECLSYLVAADDEDSVFD